MPCSCQILLKWLPARALPPPRCWPHASQGKLRGKCSPMSIMVDWYSKPPRTLLRLFVQLIARFFAAGLFHGVEKRSIRAGRDEDQATQGILSCVIVTKDSLFLAHIICNPLNLILPNVGKYERHLCHAMPG